MGYSSNSTIKNITKSWRFCLGIANDRHEKSTNLQFETANHHANDKSRHNATIAADLVALCVVAGVKFQIKERIMGVALKVAVTG